MICNMNTLTKLSRTILGLLICYNGRSVGCGYKEKLFFIDTAIPSASVMSVSAMSFPFGSFQSKWQRNWAKGCSRFAEIMPRQILFPSPKRRYLKLFPMKSVELISNLCGLKLLGPTHNAGSLPMPQIFSRTSDFRGILYPSTLISSLHAFGSKGIGGCKVQIFQCVNITLFDHFLSLESMSYFSLRLCHHIWVSHHFRHGLINYFL